jgi:hypothetical protein
MAEKPSERRGSFFLMAFPTQPKPNPIAPEIMAAHAALQRRNIALADLFCQTARGKYGDTPELLYCLAAVAHKVGLNDFSRRYLQQALSLQSDFAPALEALAHFPVASSQPDIAEPRYLLIKSWGSGLWSCIDHLLGQLLVCEITGRIPIVHWGDNCLFGGTANQSSFTDYFLPISNSTINDLLSHSCSFFPGKWMPSNLRQERLNTLSGPDSRMAAIYYLARPEAIAVSDFHTGIFSIATWIPPTHPLAGKTVHQLYRHLILRYLNPQPDIVADVDKFYQQYLAGRPSIAIHIRGSDKVVEYGNLAEMNSRYDPIIRQTLEQLPDARLFLLTDDASVFDHFHRQYGSRTITTNVQRSPDGHGVHYLPTQNRRQLGREVMIDTFVATRCDRFIGNGCSNLSALMHFLKDWPDGAFALVEKSQLLAHNIFLHNW